MNALLTALKVPADIQEFFGFEELLFKYGDDYERFEKGFHRIPTTASLWMAGGALAKEVIITNGVMEALAYLTLNRHRYTNLSALCFIAIGNFPHGAQLLWIRSQFSKVKYTLVFSNDLLGKLTDIRIATGLRGKPVTFRFHSSGIEVQHRLVRYQFREEVLSLDIFQKASGIRTGIRTIKSKSFNSFLDQLKYESE
jgi:hypothetical protein